jgi:DNA-binding NarL/FixJ family response regulator
MPISVIVADDHPIVRQGMKNLLNSDPDFLVVGDAGDGLSAVLLADKLKPDVLVVDMMMPGLNGLEVIRQVKERSPATRIIVLSMQSSEAYVVTALKNGASGYMLKETDPGELLFAVREIIAGRRYLSDPLSQKLIDAFVRKAEESWHDPYETLTNREREIFQLTVEGHTNPEIAKKLSISPRTAETHRASMMNKLGLHSQTDLIRLAIRRGLLSVED